MVMASMTLELNTTCPKCSHEWDLFSEDDANEDGWLTDAIFNGKREGIEVECPGCEHEFEIDKIDW